MGNGDTSNNVLCSWSSVRYNEGTTKYEFFDASDSPIVFTDEDFRSFIDEDLFIVGRCQTSKTSLLNVKDKRGVKVMKNVVARTSGGYTRAECKVLGITLTSLLDANNGAKMATLLRLTKPHLELEGVGYCMLKSAYALHPTLTVTDALKFASIHNDEERGGSLVRVINPNALAHSIHDFYKDYYFKCIHNPNRTRDEKNARLIEKLVKDCSRAAEGKLLIELQEKNRDAAAIVNINHFVAYDAERNIVVEPSQKVAIEVVTGIDNYPLILEALGYKDYYEIVGLYKLVAKPSTR